MFIFVDKSYHWCVETRKVQSTSIQSRVHLHLRVEKTFVDTI